MNLNKSLKVMEYIHATLHFAVPASAGLCGRGFVGSRRDRRVLSKVSGDSSVCCADGFCREAYQKLFTYFFVLCLAICRTGGRHEDFLL